MQIVLDFKSVDECRPTNLEFCLIILVETPDNIYNATYYEISDEFLISELSVHKASEVLWAKASL